MRNLIHVWHLDTWGTLDISISRDVIVRYFWSKPFLTKRIRGFIAHLKLRLQQGKVMVLCTLIEGKVKSVNYSYCNSLCRHKLRTWNNCPRNVIITSIYRYEYNYHLKRVKCTIYFLANTYVSLFIFIIILEECYFQRYCYSWFSCHIFSIHLNLNDAFELCLSNTKFIIRVW